MSPSQTVRLLVVDDERPLADSLAQILWLAGFEVVTCYDGASAITTAATFKPDIVISDYSMGNLNGIEACSTIKALLPGCRIIILSAHSLPHEHDPGGEWDYLFIQKPIHPTELLRLVRGEATFPSLPQPLRVLTVDDVEAHRYSVSRLFKLAGFEVDEAGTAREALDSADQSKPDLILLDVHLPDGNGFEVCSALRKSPATANVVIMHVTSSATDEESRKRSLHSGADEYVPFPIAPKKLVSRSRELLQMRYLQNQAM